MEMQTQQGLSKKAQIEALYCLEGDEMMGFDEIAEKVGTSVKYVCNIIYDAKTNGGLDRAHKRWLKRFPEERNDIRRRNYEKGRKFDHHRFCRYTEEEIELILGGFKGTDRELAKEIYRSVQAIQARRCILKKRLRDKE